MEKMNPRKKEQEILIKMLDHYKEMPFLWDKKNKNYTNQKKRIEGNSILLEVYKQIEEDATFRKVAKKISSMRTNYIRELKKVKRSEGTSQIYTPSLWYFDHFRFLDNTVKMLMYETDHDSSVFVKQPFPAEASSQESVQNPECSPTPYQKKDEQSDQKKVLNPTRRKMMRPEKHDHNMVSMKEDDWEVLGKSIGLQLRTVKERELTIAQKLIADVIFYAKLGKLTEEARITLGSPSFPTPSSSRHSYNGNKFCVQSPKSESQSSSSPHVSPQYQLKSDPLEYESD